MNDDGDEDGDAAAAAAGGADGRHAAQLAAVDISEQRGAERLQKSDAARAMARASGFDRAEAHMTVLRQDLFKARTVPTL